MPGRRMARKLAGEPFTTYGARRRLASITPLAIAAPPAEGKLAATWGKDVSKLVRGNAGKIALGIGGAYAVGGIARRSGRGVDKTRSRPTGMYQY